MESKTTAEVSQEQGSQSSIAGWFAEIFGQCTKAPAVEGDLKFDDADKKEKKQKKQKKSKKAGDEPPAAKGNCDTSVKPALDATAAPTPKVCRYMLDNSTLQVKNRPGIAFRYSKQADDKARSEEGFAKWGDILEGVDEGDGWLKVGQLFLPMVLQGKHVLTLVTEAEPPSRAEEPSLAPSIQLAELDCKVRSPGSGAQDLEPLQNVAGSGCGTEDFGPTAKDPAPPSEPADEQKLETSSLEVPIACAATCNEGIVSLEKHGKTTHDDTEEHAASDDLLGCKVEDVKTKHDDSEEHAVSHDLLGCEVQDVPAVVVSPAKEEAAPKDCGAQRVIASGLPGVFCASSGHASLDTPLLELARTWNSQPLVESWLRTRSPAVDDKPVGTACELAESKGQAVQVATASSEKKEVTPKEWAEVELEHAGSLPEMCCASSQDDALLDTRMRNAQPAVDAELWANSKIDRTDSSCAIGEIASSDCKAEMQQQQVVEWSTLPSVGTWLNRAPVMP